MKLHTKIWIITLGPSKISFSTSVSPDLLNFQLLSTVNNRIHRWIGQDQILTSWIIFHRSTLQFDQDDHHDLLLQSSSTNTPCQQYIIQQDHPLLTPCNDHVKDQIMKSDHGQPRKQSISSLAVNDDVNPADSRKKKIMHREIERQRRQEMATLYRALRSRLPLEYLKGKRSISDHTHEAVKYIKHLQTRIRELGEKRDELQRLCSSSSSSFASECSQSHHPEDNVTVRPCLAGVEFVVNTTALREGLPLSRVLEILIGEGLNIVNCITMKINERLLHTIVSEVSDGGSIDLNDLQQKIIKLTVPGLN